MKNFLRKKENWIVIALILGAILFVYYYQTVFLQKLSSQSRVSEVSSQVLFSSTSTESVISPPLSLEIPALGVKAAIEYVGINSIGEMDVPKDYNNVAWFNLGPFPGVEGSAVIAGHLDDQDGQKAVFYDLEKLKAGDKVFIEDEQDKIITFIVRETRIYDSEDFAPEVFSSSQGEHLNLVTCTGSWSKKQGRYTKRLVVFTDRE